LGVALLRINGAKKAESEWFNPAEMMLKKREAEEVIPRPVAQAYLRLEEKNKIPRWVQGYVDRKKIKLAAI
jgi:hypothetical protein